jgi:dTDP-4-amino-4,6-dideoxygalactose transaminase
MDIPFHKPYYDTEDEKALLGALRSGKLIGDGEYTRRATAKLCDILNVKHALLTTSCTHALELAVMSLRLRAGDEVIMPSFTFVSTPNAVLRQGAKVVFADILPSTLTIDPADVHRKVSSRTRAIIPIVYAGISPDMDELMSFARRHRLGVVEDAAQGLGALYKGKAQGTLGDIGCFSFHETKNLSTGEGGALVTNDDAIASRAEIIREKGTNRKQFMLGLVDKYTWVDVGSSFLPPDSTAALLLSQLGKMDTIIARRRRLHERYVEALNELVGKGLLTLPTIPGHTQSNYHIFHVLMHDEETRNGAIRFFRSRNIGTAFHYLPLHLSPIGMETLGGRPGDCPVTESVSGRLLRLPIYPGLTEAEQDRVIQTMMEFFKQ